MEEGRSSSDNIKRLNSRGERENMDFLLKNAETSQLFPSRGQSEFCLVSSGQLHPSKKMNIKPRKQLKEVQTYWSKEAKNLKPLQTWSGMFPALKQPQKGKKLNCSRKYTILNNCRCGKVRRGESSEGDYGVNAEKWMKMADRGNRAFCLLSVEGAELKLEDHYSVSQQQSPLQHQ